MQTSELSGVTHARRNMDKSVTDISKKKQLSTLDLKSRGKRFPYRFDPGHRHQTTGYSIYGLAVCLYPSGRSSTAKHGNNCKDLRLEPVAVL